MASTQREDSGELGRALCVCIYALPARAMGAPNRQRDRPERARRRLGWLERRECAGRWISAVLVLPRAGLGRRGGRGVGAWAGVASGEEEEEERFVGEASSYFRALVSVWFQMRAVALLTFSGPVQVTGGKCTRRKGGTGVDGGEAMGAEVEADGRSRCVRPSRLG